MDIAILHATRNLVVECGYNGLSLAAVAERAGTTTSAIYRRWSGKAELVHDAIFPTGLPMPPAATGSLYGDVRATVEAACAIFARPEVRIALPCLLAESQSDRRLHTHMFGRICERLAAAHAADVDVATSQALPLLVEMIAGAVMLRAVGRPLKPFDEHWVTALTDLVVHGLSRA